MYPIPTQRPATPCEGPAEGADEPCCCPTRLFISSPPTDLVTWAKAAAATQRTPYAWSERRLRDIARQARLTTYPAPRERGRTGRPAQALVSLSAVLELHRDVNRGWHPTIPPPRGKR